MKFPENSLGLYTISSFCNLCTFYPPHLPSLYQPNLPAPCHLLTFFYTLPQPLSPSLIYPLSYSLTHSAHSHHWPTSKKQNTAIALYAFNYSLTRCQKRKSESALLKEERYHMSVRNGMKRI